MEDLFVRTEFMLHRARYSIYLDLWEDAACELCLYGSVITQQTRALLWARNRLAPVLRLFGSLLFTRHGATQLPLVRIRDVTHQPLISITSVIARWSQVEYAVYVVL